MDRNREARRVAMATPKGLARRRHRTSSLRDSQEDDGPLELQESARFRDRTGKKDRDREKERSDRERDRSSRSKRRRGEKYIHGTSREDGVDDSSEESDEDEEELEDAPARLVPPNPASVSSSSFPSSALTSSRQSYPPPSKVFRVAPTWRGPNEMIGFPVPRKARSASTKRSHDWISAGIVGGQTLLQTSSSPVRPSMVASSTVSSPSPAPMSPSSSSLSMKKKIKANGPKQRPPKSSTKSPFSIQDDIEIEVAEVLYGLMRQSQGRSKQEMMPNDSREVNRSTGDSKSRASSPASNSGSVPAQDSPTMPQNSSSSASPLSAVAPKRKRPRTVSQPEENTAGFASRSSPISTAPKMEPDLLAKEEVHSPQPEKNSDSAAENGGVSLDLLKSHGSLSTREAVRSEPASGVLSSEEKGSSAIDQSLGKDTAMVGKVEEVPCPKQESVEDRVHHTAIQQITTTTTTGEKESRREEKFEIDLMAPPPQSRSSPEREGEMDHHDEPMFTDGEAELKSKPSESEKTGRAVSGRNADLDTEVGEKVPKSSAAGAEECETQKPNLNKARNIDLHLDLERIDRSLASSGGDDNKLNQQLQKQPPLKPSRDDTSTDKPVQPPSSLPLSMTVPAGWPAGLPPMGYMAPLQGVVSMDGRNMGPTSIQPQPGRCATHCCIAKNIYSHQQFMKNYPFWPAAAAAAPLFGARPYNLNVVPAADLHGNAAGRGDVNPVQDRGQTLAFFPGQPPAVKDKGAQPATNMVDGAQKTQFYQSLPPGGPSNILHGPASLFFPLGQQVAAAGAAASARANSTKAPVPAGTAASASMSTSVLNASVTAGQASPTPMSYNYPNMPANETQYLAILANGAYQLSIPTHVGVAQAYRGAHGQVMPFFNGSYYSSQILHPCRLQQQQQATPSEPVQIQQNNENPSISVASSSSQKRPQNQQQRPQGSSVNGVTTNPGLQTFPNPKSRAPQTQQLEMGGEGSPSTADSRLTCPPTMSVYGQNFTSPFNPSSFALMTPPASVSGATSGASNGNHAEKQQQQPQTQQQALKTCVESLAPQAFAMSFTSINGAATANIDVTSMAQNHAILQSLPEAARNNYHIMAAAAAAKAPQPKKNYHGSEDGKSGAPDSSNVDDERKGMSAKASASTVQSIAFSRPDLVESSAATVSGNNVVDSSARSLNLVPGSAHSSRPSVPSSISNFSASSSQQQQFIQLQKQQQFAVAAMRNKAPVTGNGSVYTDHLSSASTIAAKFSSALSGFPPSIVQGSNTSAQSPQWKNSGRTVTSQVSSPSVSTSVTTSMKNLGQQQGRPQQGHTQISFGGNPKATAAQAQQGPNATQSPSPPMMVGSPSTSSVSKGHSGSPRMTSSSSIGNKTAQASSLSTQSGKNSPSLSGQKSSPVAVSGQNVQSVFGSSYMPISSSMGSSKPQLQQQSQHQLQQPQLSKQSIRQAQMFFSNAYLQTHSTTSSSAASTVGGFQLQRHRTELQQPLSKTTTSANATTNDPAKAVAAAAAAAGNIKGGIKPQGALPPTVFTYAHEVVAAAARMQAEREQPAD